MAFQGEIVYWMTKAFDSGPMASLVPPYFQPARVLLPLVRQLSRQFRRGWSK